MNSQITPEQAEILLTLCSLILVAVVTRLAALVAWRKWFGDDAAPDNLTQEERDERLVTRRRRPR
ncbi:hypothetical protein HRW09_02285 [Streptomyces lunaelactis]|uniref:hypothetical protein n=1 Tax=Streptomyces lunaelactis TaxID=1535768 RepID=UPI001584755A|nr:hypothetical protein [Streptomyces lunaelactis]NUL28415.1 hypothetical protein [Streptomyces lunaelactis]